MSNTKRAASIKERIGKSAAFSRPEGVRILLLVPPTSQRDCSLRAYIRAVRDVVLVHVDQGEVRVLHHDRAPTCAFGRGDEAAGSAQTHVRSPPLYRMAGGCGTEKCRPQVRQDSERVYG